MRLFSLVRRPVSQVVALLPVGLAVALAASPNAGALEANPPQTASSTAQAPSNPTGSLSLRDAVSVALLQNPDLSSFAWEVRAREARALQAGRFSNPVLGVLAEDLGARPRIGDTLGRIQPQTTIELSQLIELGGKRSARQRLAATQRDLASRDFEAVRLDVLTRVAQTFVDVLAGQEAMALAQEARGTAEQVHKAVSLRVEAGVVSPIEETKAGVALSAARIEADKARRALDTHRASLAALWGSSEALFESATGDLGVLPPVPALSDLRARLSKNPDLARWATEVAQREATVSLESSKRWPDLTLTAGYRRFREIDSRAFLIGASIPLPLFDRNRDGIEEARSRVSRALAEKRSAEARLAAALVTAHSALNSAKEEIAAIEATVLPGAQSAFSAIEEGYRLGKFGILDVLDAQRILAGARSQRLRALSQFHQAAASVERLVGQPIEETVVSPAPVQ